MTMTASIRAAFEAMTGAQLSEIIRFARMDQTGDLACRKAEKSLSRKNFCQGRRY